MVELDEKAVEAAVRAYSQTLRHNHEVGPILKERRNKAVIAAITAYLAASCALSAARSEGAREATERAASLLAQAKDEIVRTADDLSMHSPAVALVESIAEFIGQPELNSRPIVQGETGNG
jgi:hypothetical protein